MKILYSFPHPLGSSGIGTIAEGQVRGLVGLGHEVWVYTTSSTVAIPGVKSVVETMRVRGRRVPHRAVGVDRAYRYHDWRVAAAVRSLRSEVGLQVVHSWPLASARTLASAQEVGVLGCREVPNTHTADAYETANRAAADVGVPLPDNHSHAFNGRRLALEEVEYDRAAVLLVPSAVVEDSFLRRSYSPEKLARHQYGFDPARIPLPQRDPTSALAGAFTAVFAGRCEPRKGLHHALRAWINSGAGEAGRFLVCGSFVPGYRERLLELLGHPSVEELGFVTDIAPVLRAADILVFPSLEEGSALVTYEAQASGCVLVASDASGALCPDPEQALIHRAGDEDELASHIALLHTDRGRLSAMREKALANRDQLTWHSAAGRLADIYAGRLNAV